MEAYVEELQLIDVVEENELKSRLELSQLKQSRKALSHEEYLKITSKIKAEGKAEGKTEENKNAAESTKIIEKQLAEKMLSLQAEANWKQDDADDQEVEKINNPIDSHHLKITEKIQAKLLSEEILNKKPENSNIQNPNQTQNGESVRLTPILPVSSANPSSELEANQMFMNAQRQNQSHIAAQQQIHQIQQNQQNQQITVQPHHQPQPQVGPQHRPQIPIKPHQQFYPNGTVQPVSVLRHQQQSGPATFNNHFNGNSSPARDSPMGGHKRANSDLRPNSGTNTGQNVHGHVPYPRAGVSNTNLNNSTRSQNHAQNQPASSDYSPGYLNQGGSWYKMIHGRVRVHVFYFDNF